MKIRNGTQGRDRLVGGGKDDHVLALGGNDVVLGRGGDDVLDGGSGKDRLDGGEGNDELLGGLGDDQLLGGSGEDRLDGGTGGDTMRGGSGNDTYVVDDARDRIVELVPALLSERNTVEAWIDYRLGANLHELVLMGEAVKGVGNGLDNRLLGNGANNGLVGGGGADELYGMDGRDRLDGGEGDDWLEGGSGDDVMIGGTGNDTFVIDSNGDTIVDSEGLDTVLLVAPLKMFVMDDEIENLTIFTAPAGPDERISVIGNGLGNRIDGGAGNDIIDGLGGDDLLYGGGGYDVIYAGAGDDVVIGSQGGDSIYLGGEGRDSIVFQAISEVAGVHIEQFGAGDRIDLSVIDASSEAGDQAFSFLGSAAFTGREGELRCETEAGGFFSRLSIDLDGDKVADVSFSVAGTPPTDVTFNL